MARLIKLCEGRNVRAITVEPQYPENAARTLSQEVERKVGQAPRIVPVDTLETAVESDLNADWYETKMRQNLKNLVDGLQ